MNINIRFLGAAGTVTGSKFLLESNSGQKILIDCGLFQGFKNYREKNWAPMPFDWSEISAIILTHAHIDHSGYLPKAVADGFRGPIFATHATRALAEIMLLDSARLKEEDTEFAKRKHYSRHEKPLPLYTEEDAIKTMKYFRTLHYKEEHHLGDFYFRFSQAGHILGAASVLVKVNGTKFLFSGDIGRYADPLMFEPAHPPEADFVIMESTYGNRLHAKLDMERALEEVVRKTLERKAVLLIPSFAVGRSQNLIYLLYQIFKRCPELKIPVYLNSPMASSVTRIYERFVEEHKLDLNTSREIFESVRFVSSVEESKELNEEEGPMIILSASGMLAGGRVLHHLEAFGPDPNNIILLVGYQAGGTRGANLLAGEKQIKFHGYYHEINAEIINFDFFSAHADQEELLTWLASIPKPPQKVFLVHGEEAAADKLRLKIEERLGFSVTVPLDNQSIIF